MQNRDLWRRTATALIGGILLCIWAARGADFTIVALPDTQFYSKTYPEIAEAQTRWIVDNRATLNIVYVAHLGDITDGGSVTPKQWTNAAAALYRLESVPPEGIPYGVVPGNHDHLGGTSRFNSFFGVEHFSGRSYYGGHFGKDNNSHFDRFSAGELDFVVLYIDFDWRKDAPMDAWADGVLQANAKRRAIVVSHDLIDVAGGFDPRGQAIYDNLKGNPNLFLMLCGHHHGEARRFDSFQGRTVLTCLSDYQALSEGGGGFLRLYRFFPRENLVRVQTYSPWLDRYKTDPASQFEFRYRMDRQQGPPSAR